MSVIYYSIVLLSFFLGIVLIILLRKLAVRYKILISKGTPLVGGISMGLSFLFTCLIGYFLYRTLSPQITGIIFASAIILVFGIIDDWRELSVTAKFLIQITATVLLILFGIRTQIVYIGNLLNTAITFLWVIGITNAFNHLDVIDGLTGGVAMIVSLAFFTISLLNSDIKTAILSLALIGAIASFLIHNLPPAKIYMGNCGSHLLGFILAATALGISYAPLERKIALFSPLLILGFPIFDTAFLILIRLSKKKLPFRKSNDHLALRFLALGYSKKKALLIMLVLGLFFSFSGVLLSQVNNTLGMVIIAVTLMVSLVITQRMSRVSING